MTTEMQMLEISPIVQKFSVWVYGVGRLTTSEDFQHMKWNKLLVGKDA